MPKFSLQVVGKNTLETYIKSMCTKAGVFMEGRNLTNHSGKVTCAAQMFAAGFDEQTIMSRTGHKSSAVRTYKRQSSSLLQEVSGSLQPPKPTQTEQSPDPDKKTDAPTGTTQATVKETAADEGEENEVDNDEQVTGTSTGGVTPSGFFAIGWRSGRQKRMENFDERVAWGQAVANVYLPQGPFITIPAVSEGHLRGNPPLDPLRANSAGKTPSRTLSLAPLQRLASTKVGSCGVTAGFPTQNQGVPGDHLARPYGYAARNK
ncbi:Hypp6952 [Branchiostoma lanceolatum]|uniref:Hypp6952 protein n=1 Tax=Branchiostoma lanceolatum TaxID=7740 RepID=A0A8J9YVZ6_BRALA|nr:Hypp6952 [Branchiostoma lanceolatum]